MLYGKPTFTVPMPSTAWKTNSPCLDLRNATAILGADGYCSLNELHWLYEEKNESI